MNDVILKSKIKSTKPPHKLTNNKVNVIINPK